MIGIRADANKKIASGHLMRCMAIGEKLRQSGEEPLFLIADEFPVPMLEQRAFSYCVLHSDWQDKSGEIPMLKEVIRERGIDVLLVDSYEVSEEYFKALLGVVRLVYLDDLCRDPWPVDALVNYAVADAAKKYQDFSWEHPPKFYTGLSYTPLRAEFEACAGTVKEEVSEALLTTGGSDPCEMTRLFLEIAFKNGGGNVRWHVAAGPFFSEPLKAALRQMQAQYPEQLRVHENERNMAALAGKCQLAVCAGGTTLLELCACGLPCICFTLSENQKALVHFLKEKQAVAYGGDVCSQPPAAVAQKLWSLSMQLTKASAGRKGLIEQARGLIDAKGAGRIAGVLTEMR